MKGYVVSEGYMGLVDGEYELFTSPWGYFYLNVQKWIK